IALCIDHFGQQDAGGSNDRAPWLQQKMQTERTNALSNHSGVVLARRGIFRRIAHSQPAAQIQIFQPNPGAPQFRYVSRDAAECAAKWIERNNLRTDMRADSLPMQILRILVSQIQPASLRPIEPKLVRVASRRDVRMAARRNIRIHANCHSWNFPSTPCISFGFLQQDFQLDLGLRIEQKNSATTESSPFLARRGRILQGIAYFVASLPDSRKYDPVAANPEMPQMFELSAGDNVKTAAHLCQILQDGKIPVGLHRETDRVRNLTEAAVELTVSIRNRRAAIKIGRRAKRGRGRDQVGAFAKHALNAFFSSGLFPCELRREFGRVDKPQLLACICNLRVHLTFNTTSVRSSARGALWANQSTSRKIRSAISVALTSCCCSMSVRSFSVP